MKKEKNTVRVPLSATFRADGTVEWNYQEIPLEIYIKWLKRCYDLSGA